MPKIVTLENQVTILDLILTILEVSNIIFG